MTGFELEVANTAARELRKHGTVKLEYITAEFEPYSSAQRPDLVFWPDTGPNKGCTFFIELRMPANPSRRLPSTDSLQEHKDFLGNFPPNSLFFAIGTSRKIDDDTFRSDVSSRGIEILDNIESGKDLARKILGWSHTPQSTPQKI